MAACQLAAENVAEGDSLTVPLSDEWSFGLKSLLNSEKVVLRLLSSGEGDVGSCLLLDASACSFSGVGQIPSCSYRSKKLELVGGALNDMLVERERGRMTAPELDRGRITAPELERGRMNAPELERDIDDSDPDASGMV